MKNQKDKYQYNPEFQEKILAYTIKDDNGWKALNMYQDYYFDLIEFQIIAAALKTHFKKKQKIPRDRSILKEDVRVMLRKKEFKDLVSDADKNRIDKVINKLYKTIIKDGDDILEAVTKFASFVEFKEALEKADVYDFNSYEAIIKDLQKAVNKKSELDTQKGTFLIQDIRQRQVDRAFKDSVQPLPFKQLNSFTNAGGYGKGSIFVLLDKAKGFKTGVLANMIRGYMRMRKRIILFDLENGEDALSIRLEQSIANKNKLEILSGKYNKDVQKILRKYQRIGVEVIVKRVPAYSKASDLKRWIKYYYDEFGIRFDEMFIDYIGLMGSERPAKDDNERIGNAFLDVKNLALEEGIWHVWTPHHIGRNAYVRRATRYEPNDTAKAIDIHRHVDGMFGVNQNDEEKEGGVYRIEIIDQRDGRPEGTCYLWGNEANQRVTEFTNSQIEEYRAARSQDEEQQTQRDDEEVQKKRNKVKSDV
jgi:hypothetical protein